MSIHWEEDTSEAALREIVDSLQALSQEDVDRLRQNFFTSYAGRLKQLAQALCESLDTKISEVVVVPIHGIAQTLESAEDAVQFILNYEELSAAPILRYEMIVRYSNGDEYTMKCSNKTKAIQFLNQYIEKT